MMHQRLSRHDHVRLIAEPYIFESGIELQKFVLDTFVQFQVKAEQDPRIGPVHISIYSALIILLVIQKQNPIRLFAREVMIRAKILGVATYHKTIRQLDQFGYIQYLPSCYHVTPSRVYL